jgi:hypothetical protein
MSKQRQEWDFPAARSCRAEFHSRWQSGARTSELTISAPVVQVPPVAATGETAPVIQATNSLQSDYRIDSLFNAKPGSPPGARVSTARNWSSFPPIPSPPSLASPSN